MNRGNERSQATPSAPSENRSGGGDNLTLIQFLYVEFFGAFLPGVAAVGSVWAIMSHAARSYDLVGGSFVKTVLEFGLRPCGLVLLLFLAYSVGAIVYRRPHDEPDAASCFRIVCRNRRRHTSCDNDAFDFDGTSSKTAPGLELRPKLILAFNEWMWRLRTGRSKDNSSHAEPGASADPADKSPTAGGIGSDAEPSPSRRKCHEKVQAIFGSAFRMVMEHFDYLFRPERAWYWKREGSKIASGNSAKYRMDCLYPYPLYRRYLYIRDADHLAQYVTWCAGSPEAARQEPKGKLFINTLKQRIREFASPELVRDMVRNEAHVRTLSSLWFILRFLVRFIVGTNVLFAAIGTAPKVTNVLFAAVGTAPKVTNVLFAAVGTAPKGKHFAMTALLLWLVWYLKYVIETGFHYVRLRELNMVLETADILQSKLSCFGQKAPFSDYLDKGRDVCPSCSSKGEDGRTTYCKECPFHLKTGNRTTNEPCIKMRPQQTNWSNETFQPTTHTHK